MLYTSMELLLEYSYYFKEHSEEEQIASQRTQKELN